MKKRNEFLNIIEAIAALFVVFIHFPFPGRFGLIVLAFARFSVPFFFVVSGYFYYKGSNAVPFPLRQIKRLFVTIVVSELCYFLFYVFLQIRNTGFCLESITNVIEGEFWNLYVKELPTRLIVLSPVFNGVGWFMTSLILCYFLFWLLSAVGMQKPLLVSAPIFIILGIFLRVLLSALDVHTSLPWGRSLLLLPLPFFCFGFALHKWQPHIQKINTTKYLLALAVSIAAILTEQFYEDNTLYFGTPVFVIAAFCLCIKKSDYVPRSLPCRVLSFLGSNCGTFIYVMHMLLGTTLITLMDKLPISIESTVRWFAPILVYIVTALSATAFHIFKTKIVHRKES